MGVPRGESRRGRGVRYEQAYTSAWGHSMGVVMSRRAGHKELPHGEVANLVGAFCLSLSLFFK